MDDEVVNSEHRRKPKNARRNMDSRVKLMDGDKYPARRVCTQRARRSAVKGKCFGARCGSAFLRPLINMPTWG